MFGQRQRLFYNFKDNAFHGGADRLEFFHFAPDFAAPASSTFALAASEYMSRYGITEEQAATVAVKNRANACRNPFAHLRREITVEEVLSSRVLARPIKLLDMCPTSDGACAIIVASEEVVRRKSPNRPAWFRALATRHDQPFNADLPMLIGMRTLTDAAKEAYAQAGITRPLQELDVAELYHWPRACRK